MKIQKQLSFIKGGNMKLKDLKYNGIGIIETMNNIKPLTIFNVEGLESKDIDGVFYLLFGNRDLTTTVNEFTDPISQEKMEDLAKILLTNFYSKWERLAQLNIEDLTPTDYKMTTTETVDRTETSTGVNDNTTTDTNVEQVTGYNNEIFTDDNQQTNSSITSGTDERNDIGNTQREQTVTGYRQNKVKLLNDSVDYLQKFFINDIIYTDLLNVIALSINREMR